MKVQVSSEQNCSAEADTTAVVWKQRLDFLNEENIISQYNDQMKETLGSNASQKRSTLKVDEKLKKMMNNLKRLNVVNLTKTKNKIADLFQKIQQIVQYLKQQNSHNDILKKKFLYNIENESRRSLPTLTIERHQN